MVCAFVIATAIGTTGFIRVVKAVFLFACCTELRRLLWLCEPYLVHSWLCLEHVIQTGPVDPVKNSGMEDIVRWVPFLCSYSYMPHLKTQICANVRSLLLSSNINGDCFEGKVLTANAPIWTADFARLSQMQFNCDSIVRFSQAV